MLNYKITKSVDEINEAKKFIAENGFEIPKSGIFIVAKDDDRVVGVGVLQTQNFIEPFIAENPMVANNIYRMLEGINLLSETDLFVIINEKKMGKLMEKLGYKKIDISIWRKKWE